MRALELHAHAKQVQRSAGQSSVAAAAYRAGEKLYDERTGITHDYTRKQGVEFKRIYLPEDAPQSYKDRGALWNACEKKENRSNSFTAHELEVGFPYEFNIMQRREAGDAIVKELMRRYGCAVDICFHAPNKNNDERNFHAHILFTSRGFDPNSKDGWAKTKFRDLSFDQITLNGEKTTKGEQELLSLRQFSAGVMNSIADRDGLSVKVEHLSFEKRGIDKEPQVHLGPVANDMEKKGMSTERGDQNKNIVEHNKKNPDPRKQVQGIEYETFDEFAGAKWAEYQLFKHDQTISEERRCDKEKSQLARKIDKHYGRFDRKCRNQLKVIKNTLESKGVKKLALDAVGNSKKLEAEYERVFDSYTDSLVKQNNMRGQLEIKQKERTIELESRLVQAREKVEEDIAKSRYLFDEDKTDEKGDRSDSGTVMPIVRKTTFEKVKSKVAKKREIAEKVEKSKNGRKPSYSGSDIKYKKKQTLKEKYTQSVKSKGETDMDRRGSKPDHNITPPRGPSLGR